MLFPNKDKKKKALLEAKDVLANLDSLQKEIDRLKQALELGKTPEGVKEAEECVKVALEEVRTRSASVEKNGNEKIVEGVFDGRNMVAGDGAVYDVPANYASKSKLVEGDILKLTINNLGAFVYKQIKPIDRQRQRGILEQDATNLQFYSVVGKKRWRLLTASVTYYKGEIGDEVIFLTPAQGSSHWAAVENIVKN